MDCHNCGHKLPEDAKFCSECGADLKKNVQTNNEQSLMNQMIEKGKKEHTAKGQAVLFELEQPKAPNKPDNKNSGFEPPKSSGFSIAGFVLSLVSIFMENLAFPCGVLALVLSAIGMGKCKRKTGGHYGLAVAGLIISIVVVSIAVLYYFYYVMMFNYYL